MAILTDRAGLRPLNWLQAGVNKAKCVGRMLGPDGKPHATGFLIDGESITPACSNVPVLMTADSVFEAGGSLREYAVAFEGLFDDPNASAEVRVQQVVWSSAKLHTAICILADWPGAVSGLRVAAERPRVGDHGDAAWVVGCPLGGHLQISLGDNRVLDLVEPHLRYQAATQGGSGGSPVFNDFWEVVAVHVGHNVGPGSPYNYGTLLDVIVQEASEALRFFRPDPIPTRTAVDQPPDRLYSFLSVFISYTHRDSQFAERLYTALQSAGVRCWFDKMNIVAGEKIDEALRRGIASHDRVLLCCSESSLGDNWWVENELELAFERERNAQREQGKAAPIVIPLDLDGRLAIWDGAKAAQLRSRLAADFTAWTDVQRFDESVGKLMKALEPALRPLREERSAP